MAETVSLWWQAPGVGTSYQANQHNGLIFNGTRCRDLTVEGGTEYFDDVETNGTVNATPLPNGVSFAYTNSTGLAGRSFRGRLFMVGLTQDFVDVLDENRADASIAGGFRTALNALPALITAAIGGSALGVLSRENKDAVPTPPHIRAEGILTPTTTFIIHDLFLDYQRRRAPAHNRHH